MRVDRRRGPARKCRGKAAGLHHPFRLLVARSAAARLARACSGHGNGAPDSRAQRCRARPDRAALSRRAQTDRRSRRGAGRRKRSSICSLSAFLASASCTPAAARWWSSSPPTWAVPPSASSRSPAHIAEFSLDALRAFRRNSTAKSTRPARARTPRLSLS